MTTTSPSRTASDTTSIAVVRLEANRIIEDREFYDTASMLAQLGLTS